ncbi:disco-interacting protein 2 isoform X5 [Phlebotomus papatasi]|uniref:disco-interacting protein 2 isoform X5 n=1 Tax=Phlebotomus papatasi TaxID=29031 RepID=UPI00248459AA|nr:disco-interacting protein 2 isoform X5 [Phlebotomus papatasi]
MKPITFESIRNLLKTKKSKNKEKGVDASFKRSDSFKRISIRKSYLDRGRNKRANGGGNCGQMRPKASVIALDDVAAMKMASSLAGHRDMLIQRQHFGDHGPKSSLQEITEILSLGESKKNTREIEVQTVEMDFRAFNSTESIFCDLSRLEEEKTYTDPVTIETNLGNVSGSSHHLHSIVVDAGAEENSRENGDVRDDSKYVNTFVLSGRETSSNQSSGHSSSGHHRDRSLQSMETMGCAVKSLTDGDDSEMDRATASIISIEEMPSLVTFKTYCAPPKVYLETNFDDCEPTRIVTRETPVKTGNVSRTRLIYEPEKNFPIIDSHTFRMDKVKSVQDGGVVIRIPATVEESGDNRENLTKKLSKDSALDVEEEEDESERMKEHEAEDNGKCTFEIYRALKAEKSSENSEGDSTLEKIEETPKMSSDVKPLKYSTTFEINLEYPKPYNSQESHFDEREIISPDSSIPYPLRIKTNPFTRQKELYSVNLGRIWKQLNLGQDELSLDMGGGNFTANKATNKNESFKSMSSRDSGFSLTLTKPKSLFRRKSKKSKKAQGEQRRKPKLSVSRDGYFKRVMVVQRNSSRRKKKQKYDSQFLRDFEEFCSRRNKKEFYRRRNFEDDEDDTFTQEINDLETFYEEHLTRLRNYYMHKKKINEATISDFYQDFGERELYCSPHVLARNETLRRKCANLALQDDSMHMNAGSLNDFTFPHPDKRPPSATVNNSQGGGSASSTNRRTPRLNQFQEVRRMDRSLEEHLKYAELMFQATASNGAQNQRIYERVPYAEIQFPPEVRRRVTKNRLYRQHQRRRGADEEEYMPLRKQEISLASVFPSVQNTKKSHVGIRCGSCCKIRRSSESNDNDEDVVEEVENRVNLRQEVNSDEFSENEFITNSIGGCEYCFRCGVVDGTTGESVCICDGQGNPIEDDENSVNCLDDEDFCECGVRYQKRKVKRRKSKKRLRKNHSTLRKNGYNYYSDITQKGYEKKRTRLLQPYLAKNAQPVTDKKSPEKTVEESKPNFRGCSPYKSSQYHDVGVTEGDMRPQQILAQIAQNIKSRTTNVPSTRDSPSASGQNQQHQKKPQQTEPGNDARKNRRLGRQESRYTSEVRQEAVQQALAALKNRPKPSLPMPSKRSSVLNRSPDRDNDDSESSSEEGSIPEERISTPERDGYNLPRDHVGGNIPREPAKLPTQHQSSREVSRDHHKTSSHISERRPQNLPSQPPLSDTSSAGSPPASVHRTQKNSYDMTDISDFQIRPYAAPDITQFNNTRRGADRVTSRYVNVSSTEPGDTSTAGRWKVSAKIQQLLNTLKRPKRRPLPEFYEDNDIELEIAANPKDPNAPKPEGSTMTPVQGEQLVVMSGLSRTIEAALQRYGVNSPKTPMATVLDPNGKMTTTLTYGKLMSRAQKIAYALSTKIFNKGSEQITLKPGDRVALVYPNSDPLNFITAWYGCMFRGLVPLPIELPLSSSDSPPQQVGFLLSSCGVQIALTSEACLKGLPKSTTGEIAKLKGWPRLHWFVTEHLPKPPKDFNINNIRINEDALAYIEYTSDKEGSVMGVTVSRQAMINHIRALTMACHYTEGETVVCVLDFKREVGLWHSVLTSVLNGMHVLFIPYALMKLRPSSWMQLITKYRASCCLVKSRDLHWGLLATKDHKDISLSSLRMLLVADGANPWSLSSCDQFLSVFQSKGLRPDAICPCASSSEAFTVSLRRPGRAQGGFSQSATTGRGVLSMAALSHGVVRVDSEDSLTSLTLQDCGQVMPATTMVVVRSEGPPVLCKTDQVGEICVTSGASGTSYYGLDGLTNSAFRVQPLPEDPPEPKDPSVPQPPPKPITEEHYVRSGLLGFLGPGGLVFVCGSRDGLMTVTGRKHNADDIIATVLAVEPMRFIYRGRIAVFSIKVLRDERVCVIAEQRPDCSEEESFQWMSRVLQAVDSIHQVGIYCLALVPPNHLPKTPLGGIHLCEARRRFLEGSLHPANVLMCPHTCVTNLPKPREMHQGALQPQVVSGSSSGCVTDTSVGPASVMVGNLVQGNRLAVAQGRDIGLSDDNERKHQLITAVLRWRANSSPDHVLYTLLNSKGAVAKTLTCSELHKRAEKIAALLQERGKINPGDHVALIFPPGVDLICAFYGCLYLGAVPITIRPPHPQNLITTLPTVRMIVDVSKSVIILSIQSIIKLLKSREAATSIDPKSWPPILDIDDNPKRKLAAIANATIDSTAYLDFSVSTCGRLSGVIITHRSLSSLCSSLKLACELYPSRHVALCLDPYCGLGFAMWTLISVFSGHHSILIAPYEVEANPSLWLSTLSQYRVRDTFCSYGVIELCTKALSNSIQALKQRNVNLACVRTCVVVAEERPRVQLTQQFCKLFQALGLNTRCVSTSFGCRVNPAICVQGASSAESAQVYVDLRALRNNRVALVERGAPNSLCLIESGKLLPGVKVIIANPDTKGHCGDSHLGEIWVQSPHSADGYFTIYGDETDYNDHFNAKLVTGATTETYARTGYLGFLRRTECSQAGSILDETTPSIASRDSDNDSLHSQGQTQLHVTPGSGSGQDQELHDAVYVVGALDEVITLRGMNYHPIDIENSVLRCHKKIAECAVFTWTNLLVVVVELDGNESEALDLVPLVTNTVLEEHQLIVGVVVVVDPGVVPINSRGEKQRMHLRDGFLADQLDPIYVAYNM